MIRLVPFLTKLSAAGMLTLIIIGSFTPLAEAASKSKKTSSKPTLEIAGWIPYWATAKGTADASAHLSQLTEINPFGYTVKLDGTLNDAMTLSNSSWQSLFKDAHSRGVKVVPTVMWSDTASIYNTLSNPTSRAVHIQSIVNAVTQNNFDGVDIDYEGKSAETRDSYTQFLAELSAALYKADKDLTLDCTIEARMPLEARYSGTPPANIEYANDLPKVNQYCDRVRIMTYDQQTADLQLNAAHRNELYAPVADTDWVEKVVKYMSSDINRDKMLIGVATYGAEYQAMPDTDGKGFTYTKTSSFNPQYAVDLAKQYKITPSRNASGELYFSYVDKDQTSLLPSNANLSKLAPKGTDSGNLAAAGALAYAKKKTMQAPVTFVTWSDAEAIAEKAKLAQSLGVAGIAIFKFDGGEDPDMWDTIASAARPVINPSSTRVTTAPVVAVVAPPVVTTAPPVASSTPPATPTVTTGFSKDLQFGDENADVTRLQSILIKKGYLKVSANGYFGPATKAALTAWQKASLLPATGFFGPQSRAKIVK